jgi:DNA-binding transcriptional ArsR family regulator
MASGGKGSDDGMEDDGCRRAELISALNHPSRRRILRLMLDGRRRFSPVELGRKLDMPVGEASYHVRLLCDLHAVAQAGTQRVRGALQRFYEATIDDDPPIEALLEETEEADEACAEEERRKPGRPKKSR